MREVQKSSLQKITSLYKEADSAEPGWKRKKWIGSDRFYFQVARTEKLRKLITKVSWSKL